MASLFSSVPDMMWSCVRDASEAGVHWVVWYPLLNYFLFGFSSSIRPQRLCASLWHWRNKPARVNKSHNSLIWESERLSNSETQIINLITNECLLAYFMSCEWSNEVYYYDSIFFFFCLLGSSNILCIFHAMLRYASLEKWNYRIGRQADQPQNETLSAFTDLKDWIQLTAWAQLL